MEKIDKKIIKLIILIVVLVISILIFTNNSYSNNTISSTSNSSSATNSSNTTTSSKTTNTATSTNTSTSKKSSNANLSNLGINPHDFSGFKATVTSYSVSVPSDTSSVEIYAKAQDSTAKVSGTGKKNLDVGTNKYDVVVTAADGTTKTYTLTINRKSTQDNTSEENTENVQSTYSGDGLASLQIDGVTMTPEFDTTIYEYNVKYIGEATSLKIAVNPTDPYYKVDIVGNENLQEGENIINILVSDPDENNVATYQVIVNKSLVDQELVEKQQQERKMRFYIITGITIFVICFIILISIIKHRKKSKELEDYYDKDDEEEYDQYDDYEDEEILDEDDIPELLKEEARKKYLESYGDNKEKQNEKKSKKEKNKGKRYK